MPVPAEWLAPFRRELITEAEAKEWFALRPDKERMAVLKDASGALAEAAIK